VTSLPRRALCVPKVALIAAGVCALATQLRSAVIEIEAGPSYFFFEGARPEVAPDPLQFDAPDKGGFFVAATYAFTERIGARVAYHQVNNTRIAAQYGSPPGSPPSPLTVVVWGHYRDDIHLITAGPEFKWRPYPRLLLAAGPQVNWIASRGTASYGSETALILFAGPRARNDEGFTWGGAARVAWAVGARTAITAGYQFVDLEPSFHRRAQVMSAGVSWRF
jgi:hypothetical protein